MSEKKYAVLLNADTDEIGQMANGLQYAIDLDDTGFHVEVYFDGAATAWPDELKENPENPVKEYYDEVYTRDLVAGVCGYCVGAFDAADGVEEDNLNRIGGTEEHGPDVGQLAAEGYELITVG